MGIDDVDFLIGYMGTLAVCWMLAGVARFISRGGGTSVRPSELSPAEVAIFLDTRTRAVHTSLAALRSVGAVEVGPGGTLTVLRASPAGSTALDLAVLDAAARGVPAARLALDRRVEVILDDADAAVRRSGWTLTPGQRRLATAGKWVLWPLFFAGLTLSITAAVRESPVNVLILFVLVALAAAAQIGDEPHRSRAGERLFALQTSRYRHLNPDHRPSWNTYAQFGAAMSVALWGEEAVWAGDPVLATNLGLRTPGRGRRSDNSSGGCGDGGCGADSGGCGSDGGGCGGGCGSD
jgi:uncharacterized protein (TIGR04222 family)